MSVSSPTYSKEVGETHPWVQTITGLTTQGALADCFKRFPWLAAIITKCVPGNIQKLIADRKANEEYSINLVKKRIAKKTDRKDFLTRILENRSSDICDIQIAAHASDFITAGSETTSTALSCIAYYLFKTPHANKALLEEVRSSFASYDEINAASTAQLQYLNAVTLEGLRIYPPLPLALPRVVPEGGDTVAGHFLPAGVSAWTKSWLEEVIDTTAIDYSVDQPNCCQLRSDQLQRPTSIQTRAMARYQRGRPS